MWKTAIEVFGLFGFTFALAFLPLTKVAIGSILALLGAFFPTSALPRTNKNSKQGAAKFKIFNSEVSVSGSIRFAVIAAGIVVLLLSASEVTQSVIKAKDDVDNDRVSHDSIQFMKMSFLRAVADADFRKHFLDKQMINNNRNLYSLTYRLFCDRDRAESSDNFYKQTLRMCREILLATYQIDTEK